MSSSIVGFAIWALCGGIFLAIGISSFYARTPVGFWANIKAPSEEEMTDVKAYNKAMGKMWIFFSIFFILLGIPLLIGSNWIILSCGLMIFSIIILMIVSMKIERKYRIR